MGSEQSGGPAHHDLEGEVLVVLDHSLGEYQNAEQITAALQERFGQPLHTEPARDHLGKIQFTIQYLECIR